MIRSFKGRNAESVFTGKRVRGLSADIQRRTRRKLRMLDAALAFAGFTYAAFKST
jgi:plasmid maintenance system killer protein